MRFQSPQLGALGVTFTALRALQFLSLVAIIGLTGNFINEFASSQREVPDVLVGTITVTSISALYVAISYILYYDGMLPLLVSGVLDTALLVASIVVAVTIGKPLSALQCELLPESVSPTPMPVVSVTSRSYESAAARYNSYLALISIDQPHCYEIKAVWGLDIALTVLLSFSALVCVGLWRSLKRFNAPNATKDVERPTALGTRLLNIKSPGFGSRFPPPLSLPEAAHRRPIRGGGKDTHHVPTPPIAVKASNAGPTGRSLMDPLPPLPSLTPPPPRPPTAHLKAPPPAPSLYESQSPVEDSIPILYEPVPKLGKTTVKTPTLVIVPPPPPSDDGFTPVTPSPSPRLKAFKRIRVSQLPRDALGIATVGFSWRRSQRAVDEYDDTTPVTPPYDASTMMDAQLAVKVKPKRKTIFEVLEGWWDLGLLERGRSLKKKGDAKA